MDHTAPVDHATDGCQRDRTDQLAPTGWQAASTVSLSRRMERFGLVGLPNAGKSSLYNALTGGGALAAPYPFATKDPNIGVAKVPDERLDRLAAMSVEPQRRARRRRGRRHRRARRRCEQGRGPRQPLPRQHPRGRRRRVRAAGVRGRRRAGPVRSSGAPARRRAGAGARRPRDRREAPRPGRAAVQARPLDRRRARCAALRQRRPVGRAAALPGRAQRGAPRAARPVLPADHPGACSSW